MSWKCICGEQENVDQKSLCKNCGRKKPSYLGINLDIPEDGKMSAEQKSVWRLMIAHHYHQKAKEFFELSKQYQERYLSSTDADPEYSRRAQQNKDRAINHAMKCISLAKNIQTELPNAQFEEDGVVQSTASIISNAYFTLGSIAFEGREYSDAIAHYQKSFETDPNQVSIYNIAMATMNLPVESTGMFAGKQKKQAALDAKKEQEAALLKKTIQYAPFSSLGIECARQLMNDYEVSEIDV